MPFNVRHPVASRGTSVDPVLEHDQDQDDQQDYDDGSYSDVHEASSLVVRVPLLPNLARPNQPPMRED